MSRPIRFGTDGVRGPAGVFPLDRQGVARIGRAVAAWVGPDSRVVLGRDTRASGPELARALVGGLVEGGAVVLDGGIMPTAAVSCAVAARGAAAGVILTASHNPWQDNGVKIVAAGGAKLLDPAPLEAALAATPTPTGGPPTPGGGRRQVLDDPLGPWLAGMPRLDLSGLHLLLDCAHGAAAASAPDLLRGMGATLSLRGCDPDGHNINAGVGSLHPPSTSAPADLALCLDGDGDRLALVDRLGPLDGDDLLWLLAPSDGPVVGTVMSNGGLEEALGGRLVRTPVGDRFVAQAMQQHGAEVGGEPSGHLLLRDGPPTSCGLYAALAALRTVAGADGRPVLPFPRDGWQRWPQARRNVRSQRDLAELQTVPLARQAGLRVLVRYSGTEPVVRVMVEGRDRAAVDAWIERICHELA